jgi:hypothetical protein
MRRDIILMIGLAVLEIAEKIISKIFHNNPPKDEKGDE